MSEVSRYTSAIPPLSTIKDPDTRRVLEALVNNWRMRNGETKPDSDQRFITKGELSSSSGAKLVGGLDQAVSSAVSNGSSLSPQAVTSLLAQLQNSVMTSRLFQSLGERISLIDLQSGANATGIKTETQERSNSDNAIVSVINTIWSVIGSNQAIIQGGQYVIANNVGAVAQQWNQLQTTVGNNTSAIRQEAFSRAYADGDLYAQYTVKIDQNGYVSGFGLASSANNSTPFSDFIVRADRFAIGNPATPSTTVGWTGIASIDDTTLSVASVGANSRINPGSSVNGFGVQPGTYVLAQLSGVPGEAGTYRVNYTQTVASTNMSGSYAEPAGRVPFIVYTTPQVVNGKPVAPGVYMDTAVIADGTISSAKIGDAQINTLAIAGNQVTQPVTAVQAGEVRYAVANGDLGVYKTLLSVVVDYGPYLTGTEGKAIIGFTTQVTDGSGGFWTIQWRVVDDYNNVLGYGQQAVSNNAVGDTTVSATVFEPGASGVRTYTLQVAVSEAILDYDWADGRYARKAYRSTMYALGAKR